MTMIGSSTRRQLGFTLVGAAAAIPPLTRAASAESGSSDANIRVVTSFLNDVVNGKRFHLVPTLWAKDMVWRGASMGEVRGVETFQKALASDVDVTFKDMKLEIKDIVASGDKVVAYFTNSGINVGAYRGHPPTGKYAIWEGMGIYRIVDGKIAEAQFCEDLYGQLKMLGIIA